MLLNLYLSHSSLVSPNASRAVAGSDAVATVLRMRRYQQTKICLPNTAAVDGGHAIAHRQCLGHRGRQINDDITVLTRAQYRLLRACCGVHFLQVFGDD